MAPPRSRLPRGGRAAEAVTEAPEAARGGLGTSAVVASAFLAGALVEKLLNRFLFRNGKAPMRSAYCMMLAPPPGPAHSAELRLAHGLRAGGGAHRPPPQQQQHVPATAAYHLPQLLHDSGGFPAPPEAPFLDGMEDEMLWSELMHGFSFPDPGPAPLPGPDAAALMACLPTLTMQQAHGAAPAPPSAHAAAPAYAYDGPPPLAPPLYMPAFAAGWGLPPAPPAVRTTATAPSGGASGGSPGVLGSATATAPQRAATVRHAGLLAPPSGFAYATPAAPAPPAPPAPATATPAASGDGGGAGAGGGPLSTHSSNEKVRRAAFNATVEELRVGVGLRVGASKHAVLLACQARLAQLAAALAAAGAAAARARRGDDDSAAACSADSTDGAVAAPPPGAGGGSPQPRLSLPPGVTVQVEDHAGSASATLASLCFARVAAPAGAPAAATLLLDACAALAQLPLTLRQAAVQTGGGGGNDGAPAALNILFQLHVAYGAPPLTAADVRDALAGALAAAGARRAAGVDVSRGIAAALGMRDSQVKTEEDIEGKRRRLE